MQHDGRRQNPIGFGARPSPEASAAPVTKSMDRVMVDVFGTSRSPTAHELNALSSIPAASGAMAQVVTTSPIAINTERKTTGSTTLQIRQPQTPIGKKTKAELAEFATPNITPVGNWLSNKYR